MYAKSEYLRRVYGNETAKNESINEGYAMQNEEKILHLLEVNNAKLTEINNNMLKVFWIVAIFAMLYFGLMIYLLFIQ